MNKNTKNLIYTALFVALTTVLTMFPKIPWVNGYIHLGDSLVLTASVLMGGVYGLFIGAIGSCLADLLSGYVIYAVATFIIKGIMGFAVGWIAYKAPKTGRRVTAVLIGAVIMLAGYFAADCILYDVGVAYISLPGNLIQGAASVVVSLVLIPIVKKITGKSSLSA